MWPMWEAGKYTREVIGKCDNYHSTAGFPCHKADLCAHQEHVLMESQHINGFCVAETHFLSGLIRSLSCLGILGILKLFSDTLSFSNPCVIVLERLYLYVINI